MPLLGGGADEVVKRKVQLLAQPPKHLRVLVHQLARANARGLRRLHVLQGVLVRARQEAHVHAHTALIARKGVRLHKLKREPDVRSGVHIRDCCCYEVPAVIVHRPSSIVHHVLRFTFYVLRFTFYVLRQSTVHHGSPSTSASRARRGFTFSCSCCRVRCTSSSAS